MTMWSESSPLESWVVIHLVEMGLVGLFFRLAEPPEVVEIEAEPPWFVVQAVHELVWFELVLVVQSQALVLVLAELGVEAVVMTGRCLVTGKVAAGW